MRSPALLLALLCACPSAEPEPPGEPDYPAPDSFALAGPGGPSTAFEESQLFEACTHLSGGPEDEDHHNLGVVWNGLLVHPWCPEWGGGGITLYDVSDPCAPVKVGEGFSPFMRESHGLSFARRGGRDFLAVDYHEDRGDDEPLGGVGFWEITDPTAPVWLSSLALPGYDYPDSYLKLTLHTFWQGPYVYVAGAFNGLYVVDARDPEQPSLAAQYKLEPNSLVGVVHAIGDRGMVSFAGGSRTTLLDLTVPTEPQVLPRGDFDTEDRTGFPRTYYFSNVAGPYGLFARDAQGGGPIVYDLWTEGRPVFVGDFHEPDGDGGYVFAHEDRLFVGNSQFGNVYDFSDPADIRPVAQVDIPGDLDTVTPMGNAMLVSVDDDALPGQATAVMPWQREPDARGPRVGFTRPSDGETFFAGASLGVSFDEMVEPLSAHDGSVRLWDEHGGAVACWFDVQENVLNITPQEPLAADTTYTLRLPDGGITDVSGNPLEDELRLRFSTGGEVTPQ